MKIRRIIAVWAPMLALVIAIQSHAATFGAENGRFSHGTNVNSIAVSPDGKTVVSGGNEGIARVWNAVNGKQIAQFDLGKGEKRQISLAFSPNGKLLAVGNWDFEAYRNERTPLSNRTTPSLFVVRLSDGSILHKAHPGWIKDVAFSADGRKLAWAGENGKVGVVDALTGKSRLNLTVDGHTASGVAFSPNGKMLACSVEDNVFLYDAANGKVLHKEGGIGAREKFAEDLAFSPDGKHLAVGWLTGLTVLDVSTQKWISPRIYGLTDLNRWGTRVAYSPDGKSLFYRGKIYDAVTFKMLRSLENAVGAFSPDGKTIWTGNRFGHIHQWDLATGKLL